MVPTRLLHASKAEPLEKHKHTVRFHCQHVLFSIQAYDAIAPFLHRQLPRTRRPQRYYRTKPRSKTDVPMLPTLTQFFSILPQICRRTHNASAATSTSSGRVSEPLSGAMLSLLSQLPAIHHRNQPNLRCTRRNDTPRTKFKSPTPEQTSEIPAENGRKAKESTQNTHGILTS